jgi:hypothetical protein
MGGISIVDHLINQLAEERLEKLFPGQVIECQTKVRHKKKVEIVAHLPFVFVDDQATTLEEVERELAALLHKQCCYVGAFILNVSFGPERIKE